MNVHAQTLRGIVDALEIQNMLARSRTHMTNAADEIERLESRIKELEQDAARIEWLDGFGRISKFSDGWNAWIAGDSGKAKISPDVRDAIDAAMNQSK